MIAWRRHALLAAGLLAAFVPACRVEPAHHEPVWERAEYAHARPDSAHAEAFPDLGRLERSPNVVAVVIEGETKDFFIRDRRAALNQFPCSNCHAPGTELGQLPRAHWDHDLVHASAGVMDCATCHGDPGADALVSLTGEVIGFDQPQNLCGQCHSTQLADWIGGAHGKRLHGWIEPRIVQACTGCHDPHRPAFESRWPARWHAAHPDEEHDAPH